jgi:aryl-alcohol dehydrogenase-like predicted oxidoreductase
VIREGKAFYWGTSEWSAAEIMEAYAVARREHLIPPSMEQPEYNMFKRDKVEREFKPLYESIGLGTTIWSPLASGVLTGKYNNGIPKSSRLALKDYKWLKDRIFSPEGKKKIEKAKKLEPVAKGLGLSLAELALAWCVKNPNVSTVITGASRPQQVKQNMKTIDKIDKLTPEVMSRINKILDNRPPRDMDFRD